MIAQTKTLKSQFDLHTRLYLNATEGVTDNEADSRNSGHSNHIKWVAGHLLTARLNPVSRALGLSPDDTYAAQFGRGVVLDESAVYPPMEEIRNKWKIAAAAMSERLAGMSEETLMAASNAKLPIDDDTVNGFLAFFMSHEAYHIGQLGILRKLAGKEAMSYS